MCFSFPYAQRKKSQDDKSAAETRANEAHATALQRASNNLNTRYKEAQDIYDQTEAAHEKLVADALKEKEAAEADAKTKKAAFDVAAAKWATDQETYSTGMKSAKDNKNQTLTEAAEDKDESDKEAQARHDALVQEATVAHNTHNAQCEKSFADMAAILDKDESTIGQVDGLVQKLNMCEQNKAKEQGQPQATSFVETQGRALRGVFDSEESTLLETSATACMSARTQLRALVDAVPAGAVTGNVADMRKRLQGEREKNEKTKATCLANSLKSFTDAKSKAADKKLADNNAANAALETATTDAETKYTTQAAKLDADKKKANADYDAANKAHEDAHDKKEEKTGIHAAKLKGQEQAMAAAAELKEKTRMEAKKHHDERVTQADNTKQDAYTQANDVLLEALKEIDTRCKTEAEELTAEKDTVIKIQASLSKLTLVGKETPTKPPTVKPVTEAPATPAPTTTETPTTEAPTTKAPTTAAPARPDPTRPDPNHMPAEFVKINTGKCKDQPNLEPVTTEKDCEYALKQFPQHENFITAVNHNSVTPLGCYWQTEKDNAYFSTVDGPCTDLRHCICRKKETPTKPPTVVKPVTEAPATPAPTRPDPNHMPAEFVKINTGKCKDQPNLEPVTTEKDCEYALKQFPQHENFITAVNHNSVTPLGCYWQTKKDNAYFSTVDGPCTDLRHCICRKKKAT